MSGDVSDRKRLVTITKGNLRYNHIYISGHHDFFPKECYGGSNKQQGMGHMLTMNVEGLQNVIETDIATCKSNGVPRNFFRKRSWVRSFLEKQSIKQGDVIAIEKTGKYKYRIYPFDRKNTRSCITISDHWPKVDSKAITAIDIFSGCGGMSTGLKKAGFKNLLAVEWDTSCCKTFKKNINLRVLHCAIQEVESFPSCDILVGGPPCQGFSNLGERVPNDPRRQLWRHFLRATKDSQPLIFVMENVPPLLKSAEFAEICREAKKLGYKVEGKILNSADYGVPQKRKRVFIIGSRIGDPVFPKPTHRSPDIPVTEEIKGLPFWRDVRSAIGDLPAIPDEHNWHIKRNPTALSQKRYKCIPPGGNRWDLPLDLTPPCWIRKTKGGTDLFGRLWWDRPSVTIRTEFYKPEKGRYLHPSENRPITHREAARLQGFEDSFEFIGKKIEVGIQMGNAVPPPLAHQIGIVCMKEIKRWYRQKKKLTKKPKAYDV